jgi:hypothetical protein
MRRLLPPIIVLAAAAICAALFAYRGDLRDAYWKWRRGPVPPAVTRDEALRGRNPAPRTPTATADGGTRVIFDGGRKKPAAADAAATAETRDARPPSFNLKVPFVPQAPFKIWDELHEETCEEASMIMLKAYLDGRDEMPLEEMEKKLQAVVEFETKAYGDYKSTDAERTAGIMRDFLGMHGAAAVPIGSIDDVKREIAAGRPVLLPAAGKLLKNPNFKNGGPLYHMLLAKGYTATTVVTNDPGTRLGADYAYADDVLWNAIHDWNGGDVERGGKLMIVVR